MHSSSAFFLAIGVCVDFLIWVYGKKIDLYGDTTNDKQKANQQETDDSIEIQPLNTPKFSALD